MAVGIVEQELGKTVVLRLEGRLDAASTPGVEEKTRGLLQKGHKHLIMNFSKLQYLSSAGMRLVLSVSKKLKASGGRLVLVGAAGDILDVIRMAGFDQVLEFCQTETEALSKLGEK